jgi:hypothetical protein
MKKILLALVSIAIALVLTPGAATAATTNPYGVPVVDPAGPNEVIFTIAKGGKKVEFTEAKLTKVKSSVISIYEPFIKKRQSFTVIPLKTFFTMVGITGKDKVDTIALNDYIYTNTAAKFTAANAYLAIKRDGVQIPYDQGGPIRIVFSDKSSWAKTLEAWNWSLVSIRAK